jgi:hypothetical protein
VIRSTVFTSTGAVVALALSPAFGQWTTLLEEDFSTNPVGDVDPSRFTDNGDGTLTAAYNTELSTTKLLWSLPGGVTLTQNDRFRFETTFKIESQGFVADPDGFAQISFGLVNSSTTGLERTGYGEFDFDTFEFIPLIPADTYDIATVDYFPNISEWFPSPSLQPVVFGSDDGNPATDAFSVVTTPTSRESALNDIDSGEADLMRDVFMTVVFEYNPATRRVTLQLLNDQGVALVINSDAEAGPGGLDGLVTTIQMDLPHDAAFTLDSFALLLWGDSYVFGGPSVAGNVVFDHFIVLVPEPGTLAVLGLAIASTSLRRRPRTA